jgi:type I restriction enzyme R subunit
VVSNLVSFVKKSEILDGTDIPVDQLYQTFTRCQELLDLAKRIREEQHRGKDLGLNEDEVAFYDALADNESAKQVLGDDTLKTIAREFISGAK